MIAPAGGAGDFVRVLCNFPGVMWVIYVQPTGRGRRYLRSRMQKIVRIVNYQSSVKNSSSTLSRAASRFVEMS